MRRIIRIFAAWVVLPTVTGMALLLVFGGRGAFLVALAFTFSCLRSLFPHRGDAVVFVDEVEVYLLL